MDKQQARSIWDEYVSRVSVPRGVQEAVDVLSAPEPGDPVQVIPDQVEAAFKELDIEPLSNPTATTPPGYPFIPPKRRKKAND